MAGSDDVDTYLAALPDAQRRALEQLRATIRAGAPDATESIAYGMPAFRVGGRFLLSYAGFRDHCSLFPASGAVLEACGDQVTPYLSGKATIRFKATEPLPTELVQKIVRIRLTELG